MRDAGLDDLVRRRSRNGVPSIVIAPEDAGSSPEMTRSSVVLPAPFEPITATASPAFTDIEMPNSAWKLP